MANAWHKLSIPFQGSVLSRSYLSQLADNGRYWHGIIDRMRPVPELVVRNFSTTSNTQTVWTGYLLYQNDAPNMDTMRYQFGALQTGDDAFDVHLKVDGNLVDSVTGNTPGTVIWNKTSSPYYTEADLSGYGFANNSLVKVTYVLESGESDGTGYLIAPWTVVKTADYSFQTATGSFTDGESAEATDFSKVINNENYFNQVRPRQMPGHYVDGAYFGHGATTSYPVWRGIIPYDTALRKVWYRIWSHTNDSLSDGLGWELVFNEATELAAESCSVLGAVETWEGTATLPSGLTADQWYTLNLNIVRDSGVDSNMTCGMLYCYYGPQSASSIGDPGEYTVGQYVYGSTNAQNTRLENIAGNQTTINGLLERKDWVTRNNRSSAHSNYPTIDPEFGYYMQRQGDFLFYQGSGVRMWYAGSSKSQSLPDAPSNYGIVDLNGIVGLHYGMSYELEGTLLFACEV